MKTSQRVKLLVLAALIVAVGWALGVYLFSPVVP